MNIVLLSGGSGKRLWPLSNSIRSKQFIQLFRTAEDSYESMVQRVYRQIRTVDQNANIVIATSQSQVSEIKHQLNDAVSVCVEPCRRDTFPAIVLAVNYLHDVMGVSDDDSVVICPVDPFVDNSYYQAVQQLDELVKKNAANLCLMGIQPTYPSEKYGYIIPESMGEVSSVKEFREKPDTKTAEQYLKENALWNAGVFAFKVGYLIQKSHEQIVYSDYKDLLTKYSSLSKISFDYAFVEKEKHIQVLRYNGSWKDVGTWNMMAEVMTDHIKGNAVMDDACSNTHIVNELDTPIIAMGCKDMVIAASNDGILVTDKQRSGYMKPYVEKVESDPMYAEKSWGTYTVVDIQPGAMTVKVSMRAGEHMTYHSHDCRNEVWTVLSGAATAVIDGKRKSIKAGDVIMIPAGSKHILQAKTDLDVIEVQLGENISVSDKKKYPFPE